MNYIPSVNTGSINWEEELMDTEKAIFILLGQWYTKKEIRSFLNSIDYASRSSQKAAEMIPGNKFMEEKQKLIRWIGFLVDCKYKLQKQEIKNMAIKARNYASK
jgi:hypothetical protein